MLEKFKQLSKYTKKLISKAKLTTLPEKVLGLCFLLKIKHRLNLIVNPNEITDQLSKNIEESEDEKKEESGN